MIYSKEDILRELNGEPIDQAFRIILSYARRSVTTISGLAYILTNQDDLPLDDIDLGDDFTQKSLITILERTQELANIFEAASIYDSTLDNDES